MHCVDSIASGTLSAGSAVKLRRQARPTKQARRFAEANHAYRLISVSLEWVVATIEESMMRKGHWESFSMAASFTVREIVPSSYIGCASEIIWFRKSLWRALGVNTSTETPGGFLSRYPISPMSKIDVCGVMPTSMSRSLCSVSSQEGQSQKHEGCVDPEKWVEVEQISEASIACRPRRHQEGRARRSPHGPSRLSSPLASYPGPRPRNRPMP